MLNQSEKATLSAFGVPAEAFEQELDIQRLLDSQPEDHQDRIQASVDGTFYVFPKTSSMYTVQSVKDGVIENTYTVNLRSRSSCSCYDFMMRCTSNGMFCKHIWRTRFLMKLGCLPSDDEDPYPWLISELHKDIDWVSSLESSYQDEIERLQTVENNLTKGRKDEVDYQDIMEERARILMGVF